MNNEYKSGSHMYRKHRDMIASIMDQKEIVTERRSIDLDKPGFYIQNKENNKIFSGPFKTVETAIVAKEKMHIKIELCYLHYDGEEWKEVDENGQKLDSDVIIHEDDDEYKDDEYKEDSTDYKVDLNDSKESDYPEEWLEYITDIEAARLMKYHDMLERGEKLGDYREDFDNITDKLSGAYDNKEKKHYSRSERAGVMGVDESGYGSDDEYAMEQAKKEIEDESDLALEVAEHHGQLFDNVKHMYWFIQEVAEKVKEDSALEEKDMNMGIIKSKNDLKYHIANNFDYYKDNITKLYPQDLKNTKEVFLRFLKGQEIDKEKLNKLSSTLDKKIREVGDAYDEMTNFIEQVKKYM